MSEALTSGTGTPDDGGDRYDVAVITTAALPWRTGPAYLSLWHACGLSDLGLRVAYVVPWVGTEGQKRLWTQQAMANPANHVAWLSQEAVRLGCPSLLQSLMPPFDLTLGLRVVGRTSDVFDAHGAEPFGQIPCDV